ncbi:hypothetical protein GF402_09395 [Candidatus Fermentibacteria bacterium]|nr:hypothetical protein [Candidatus Fermentibacteria bacterium]
MASLVFFLMAESGMLQEPPPDLLLDSVTATKYCYDLLQDTGIEHGCELHGSCHAVLEREGHTYVVVALGFRLPTRGYSFLYRISGGASEMIQMRCDHFDWGVVSQETGERAGAEVLHLAPGYPSMDVPLVKLSGSCHPGTGTWVEGYFELLLPTPAGLEVVFTGAEKSWSTNRDGYLRQYTYRLEDVNGDGLQELLHQGADYTFVVTDTSVVLEGPVEVSRCHSFTADGFME